MKFNLSLLLVCLILFFSTSRVEANTLECLNLNFDTTVNRKILFGYIENKLSIKKSKCIIEINLVNYKYLKSRWIIDTCREPIHIKKGFESVDVLKRNGKCTQKTNEFCKEWEKLRSLIQDEGLIFAKGEREQLKDQHGEIYCVYQLLEQYLNQGYVLSRYAKEVKQSTLLNNKSSIKLNIGNLNHSENLKKDTKSKVNSNSNKDSSEQDSTRGTF